MQESHFLLSSSEATRHILLFDFLSSCLGINFHRCIDPTLSELSLVFFASDPLLDPFSKSILLS